MPRLLRPTRNPFETYLFEIDETPLLDADQERELGYRIENGDAEARDHLVRANLRLVVSLARHYSGKGLAMDDLIAEGNFGLLRAAEGFDPSMGTRFSTYASYWVKQSIKRALMNTAKMVRLPAYMIELLVKWRRASAKLEEELRRTPTEEEIAGILSLSKKKLHIIRKAICCHNAMPQAEEGDGGWARDGTLADSRVLDPGDRLGGAEDQGRALALVDQMDKRAAEVLRLRFGLDGQDAMTLKAIGDRLGLTRERVRQIERDGLAKLREALEAA